MKKATTSKKRIQKKSKPVDQQLLDSARTLVNFSKLSPPNQRAAVAGIDWQAWMSVREGWQQVCS